jgi:hypothetical protein
MRIGFGEKIGYSFIGLMAGNVVNLAALLLIALLLRLNVIASVKEFSTLGFGQAVGLSFAVCIVSMVGWVVVGLPVALSIPTRIVVEFYSVTAGLIGVVMGLFAMLLGFLATNRGRLDTTLFTDPNALRMTAAFFVDAALIAGLAFAVYCSLVKAALRKRSKENGAPSGAPRSLAWFNF